MSTALLFGGTTEQRQTSGVVMAFATGQGDWRSNPHLAFGPLVKLCDRLVGIIISGEGRVVPSLASGFDTSGSKLY